MVPKSAYVPRLTCKRITRRRPNAVQEIADVYARARASKPEELEPQRQNGLARAKHWLFAYPKHHVVVGLFDGKTLVGVATIAHWKKSEYQTRSATNPAEIDDTLREKGANPSKTLMLEGLCVPEELRKRGYGTMLGADVMRRVEQMCAKQNLWVMFSREPDSRSERFAPGRKPVFLISQPLKNGMPQNYYLLEKD